MGVVAVHGGDAVLDDPCEAANRVAGAAAGDAVGFVVGVGDVLCAVRVADGEGTIEGVVGGGGGDVLGFGAGEHVAGCVEAAAGGAGVRALLAGGVAQAVVAVDGGEAAGVGHLGEAVQAVVGVGGFGVLRGAVGAVVVVEGLHQAVQGVVAPLALDAQAVGALHQITVGVVAAAGAGVEHGVVEAVHHLGELAQGVEGAGEALVQRAAGVVDLFGGLVAGGIEGVLDVVALGIGHFHQAVRSVVAVGGGDVVCIRHGLHGAIRRVGEGGGLAVDAARGQPAARGVSEVGVDAVDVGDAGDAARAIVGVDGGDLAGGAGDGVQVAGLVAGGAGRAAIHRAAAEVVAVGGGLPSPIMDVHSGKKLGLHPSLRATERQTRPIHQIQD